MNRKRRAVSIQTNFTTFCATIAAAGESASLPAGRGLG
jgi:hypothetical protein